MYPNVQQDSAEERRQRFPHIVERPASPAPHGRAALTTRIRTGHEFRIAICEELDALCVRPDDMQCANCAMANSCDRMLSSLMIKLLNAAVEQVGEEQTLINQCLRDPRHDRALAEHVASHAKLINDLSAYVMDWGRILPGDLICVTAALLKYWNDAHFRFHDEALLEIATGTKSSS